MHKLNNSQNSNVVLLVDDSTADRLVIERSLEDGDIDFKLISVENGVQALQLLRGQAPFQNREKYPMPTLILMDINMPVMDGKTALKHIRKDKALSLIPVIMLTTSDAEHDIQESYAAGANAYITKPVGQEKIISAIELLNKFWFGLSKLPAPPQKTGLN